MVSPLGLGFGAVAVLGALGAFGLAMKLREVETVELRGVAVAAQVEAEHARAALEATDEGAKDPTEDAPKPTEAPDEGATGPTEEAPTPAEASDGAETSADRDL